MAFTEVDRKIDALNPARRRGITRGRISVAAPGPCASWRNRLVPRASSESLVFFLSAGRVVFDCFYSLTKRFTDYTHSGSDGPALAPLGLA